MIQLKFFFRFSYYKMYAKLEVWLFGNSTVPRVPKLNFSVFKTTLQIKIIYVKLVEIHHIKLYLLQTSIFLLMFL